MQPQGSIFHSGFLGEVQFKFDLKKWTFEQKSEVVFKKTPKKWTFQKHGALFNMVALKRIRYAFFELLFFATYYRFCVPNLLLSKNQN